MIKETKNDITNKNLQTNKNILNIRNFNFKPSLPFKWIEMNTKEEYNGIRNRLNIDYLKDKTKNKDFEIESVKLNETGSYEEPGKFFGVIPHTK